MLDVVLLPAEVAAHGDPVIADARLRAVIDANYDAIWRFLRRMGVPAASVEDAAQQVLLVFARKEDAVDPSAERSFLLGTALRVAADFRKQASRSREVLGEESDDVGACTPANDASVESQLDDHRARRILDAILADFSDEIRAVFVMCDLEEMTMADAAIALDVPAGTVASRLRRGRELFAVRAAQVRDEMRAKEKVTL